MRSVAASTIWPFNENEPASLALGGGVRGQDFCAHESSASSALKTSLAMGT
jgi:hypothetical protein